MFGTYLRKIKLFSKEKYSGTVQVNGNYNASYEIDNLSITLNQLTADKFKIAIFEQIIESGEESDVSGGSFIYSLLLRFLTADIKSVHIDFNGMVFSIDRIFFTDNCLSIKHIIFKETVILKDLQVNLSRNLILIREIDFPLMSEEIFILLKFISSFPPALNKGGDPVNFKIEIDQFKFSIPDQNILLQAKNILFFNEFARIYKFNFFFRNLKLTGEKFLLNRKFKLKNILLTEGGQDYLTLVDGSLNLFLEDELLYRLVDIFDFVSHFLPFLPKRTESPPVNKLYLQGGILYENDYLFSSENIRGVEDSDIIRKVFQLFKQINIRRGNKLTVLTEEIVRRPTINILDLVVVKNNRYFIDLTTEINFIADYALYFLKKKILNRLPKGKQAGEKGKFEFLCEIKLHNFLCTIQEDRIMLMLEGKIYAKINLNKNYAKLFFNKIFLNDMLKILPYEKVDSILKELSGVESSKEKSTDQYIFKIYVDNFGLIRGKYSAEYCYARINNDSTQIYLKDNKLLYAKLGIREICKGPALLEYAALLSKYKGESKDSTEFNMNLIKSAYMTLRENISPQCKINFLNNKINFLHDEIIFDGWITGRVELKDKVFANLAIKVSSHEMGLLSAAKEQYLHVVESTEEKKAIEKPTDAILNLFEIQAEVKIKVIKNEIFLLRTSYTNRLFNILVLKYNDIRSQYDLFLEEMVLPIEILFNFLNTGNLNLDIVHVNLPDNSRGKKIYLYGTGQPSAYTITKGGNRLYKNQHVGYKVERIKKLHNFNYEDNMMLHTKEGNFEIDIFKNSKFIGSRLFLMENNKLIYAHKLIIKNCTIYDLIINGNAKLKAKNNYSTTELLFTIGTYKFNIDTLFNEKESYVRPIEYSKNLFVTLIFTEQENHFSIEIHPSIRITNFLSLGCFYNKKNECIVCTDKSCNSVSYYNLDNNLYICDYGENINFYKNRGIQLDIEDSVDLNLFHLFMKSSGNSSIYSSNRLNNLILYRFTKERILEVQWKAFLICERKILENNILYIDGQKITQCKNIYNLSCEYTQVSTLIVNIRLNGEIFTIELGDQPVEFKNILFERMYRRNTFILKISEANYKDDSQITNLFKINIKRVVVHIFSYLYELGIDRQNSYIDEQMSISLFDPKIELSLFSNGNIVFSLGYKICQADNHKAMSTLFKSNNGFFSMQLIRARNLSEEDSQKLPTTRLEKALRNIIPSNEYTLKPDLLSINLNEAVLYLSALSSGESTNYVFSFLIFPFKLTVYKAGIKIPITFNKIFLNESDSNFLSQLIEKQVYKKIGTSIFKSLPGNLNKGTVKTFEGIKKGFYGLTKSITDQMSMTSVNMTENILFTKEDIYGKMTKGHILKMHKLTIDKHNRFLSPLYNDNPKEERRRSTYPKYILNTYKEERHKAFYYFLLRNKMFKNKKSSFVEFFNENLNREILLNYVDSCLFYFDSRYYYCIICTKYIYLVDHGIVSMENIVVGKYLLKINQKEIYVSDRILRILRELK